MLSTGFASIKTLSHEFVTARGWQKHDSSQSLCLALVSEIGELADLFAWKSPGRLSTEFPSLQDSVAQELADVTIILLRLADTRDVDLSHPHSLILKYHLSSI